ncbi:MAG: elongation factor 1-beta [Thermoplasmatales archaeon]|nr:elongation factor 1-beta [Thermoplasmatales archaeon]
MGKVAIKFKLMPSDVSLNLESIKEQADKIMPHYAKIVKKEISPVAFGLKALFLTVVMPDQSPDEIVEKLEKIEGIESVTVEEVGLI